ncbi:MAG: M20/M25/M40 family metallo-hydrolase, partial [Phycisphaerae bacterium]
MANAHPDLHVVESLEPVAVWRLFAGIAAVPRPSKQEDRIRAHVRGVAESLGLSVRQDATGNLIINVPASAGCEKAPITVLQAHLDMVCEKNTGTKHDFDSDPIRLNLHKEDNTGEQIIRAAGTTLGADNGIGVAMAIAAASSDDVGHGPLELLFTIDEEAGMTGAKALTPESIKGRRLINLDSEEDDAIYIGCAGGTDTNLTWRLAAGAPAAGSQAFRVSVAGLRGGHSGCDIHENRGNAIKLLAHTLQRAGCDGLQLGRIDGGSKRNAIPREASADLCGPAACRQALQKAADTLQDEASRARAEPHLKITIEPVSEAPRGVADADTSARVLNALAAQPSGELEMSVAVDGLVQTS